MSESRGAPLLVCDCSPIKGTPILVMQKGSDLKWLNTYLQFRWNAKAVREHVVPVRVTTREDSILVYRRDEEGEVNPEGVLLRLVDRVSGRCKVCNRPFDVRFDIRADVGEGMRLNVAIADTDLMRAFLYSDSPHLWYVPEGERQERLRYYEIELPSRRGPQVLYVNTPQKAAFACRIMHTFVNMPEHVERPWHKMPDWYADAPSVQFIEWVKQMSPDFMPEEEALRDLSKWNTHDPAPTVRKVSERCIRLRPTCKLPPEGRV